VTIQVNVKCDRSLHRFHILLKLTSQFGCLFTWPHGVAINFTSRQPLVPLIKVL